jgi:hypothetical protein
MSSWVLRNPTTPTNETNPPLHGKTDSATQTKKNAHWSPSLSYTSQPTGSQPADCGGHSCCCSSIFRFSIRNGYNFVIIATPLLSNRPLTLTSGSAFRDVACCCCCCCCCCGKHLRVFFSPQNVVHGSSGREDRGIPGRIDLRELPFCFSQVLGRLVCVCVCLGREGLG